MEISFSNLHLVGKILQSENSIVMRTIPPVARQGSLPEIMQTTNLLAQPYTGSHVTVSCQASASLWGIPPCATGKNANQCGFLLNLLAILFSLAWIIYLQELLDEWFLNAL